MAFEQNQLLFNIDIPSMPINLASKYNRPEPIIIEKFGLSSGPIITAPKSTFQFTTISEDSLSQAVQLAKRDLKKQKEESFVASQQKKKTIDKIAVKSGPNYRNRGNRDQAIKKENKKQQENRKALLLKEREKGWNVRTAKTQTQDNDRNTNNKLAGRRIIDLPVRSMSPPTRDTHDNLTHLSGDARTLAEIRRLRDDMDGCLQKILQLYDAAQKNPAMWRVETPVYAEDIDAERKRAVRSEEQSTRSSRTIYQLNQQVRYIQDEIAGMSSGNYYKHTKKSRALSKLAAVHRGAVRALQAFIQHLPDSDLSHGLPRSYHELSLLLQQLSLCCTQLEVTGDNSMPDGVMTLLNQYAEMNKRLNQPSQLKSPPRQTQLRNEQTQRSKGSQVSKKQESGHPSALQRSEVKENRFPSPVTIDRVITHTVDRGVDATPDRQASLRAGIAALVRAADADPSTPWPQQRHKSPVPPLNLPETPRTPHGVAWEYPLEKPKMQQFKAAQRKGLLLPSKLKDQRRKLQRPMRPKSAGQKPDTHYAEPTMSSRLKEVLVDERYIPQSPPRQSRPAGRGREESPGRPRSNSLPGTPRSPSLCRRSPSPYTPRSPVSSYRTATPRSPANRDIIRLVQRNREETLKTKEQERISRLKRELGHPDDWINQAEAQIKERLQPLLDQAKCEVNADLLADSLLGDMLEESFRELQDEDIDERAAAMINAPSIEMMLQRMQDMEAEQQEIRRRWATLVYEEENMDVPARARYFDAPLSDEPGDPTPIHITSRLPDIHQTLLPDGVLARLQSTPSDEGAILFTKPIVEQPKSTTLHLSGFDGSMHIKPVKVQRKPGIPIVLSEEVIESIESHRTDFEQYLKRNSYHTVGRFNPWLIVDEIATEILDDCLRDISKELEDINNDIVNQIYAGEIGMNESHVNKKPSASLQSTQSLTSTTQVTVAQRNMEHSNKELAERNDDNSGADKVRDAEPATYTDDFLDDTRQSTEAIPLSFSAQKSPEISTVQQSPESENYSHDDDFADERSNGEYYNGKSDSEDSKKTDNTH